MDGVVAVLQLRPIGLRAANEYTAANHRHLGPVRGCKWCLSLVENDRGVVAVAIVGRPLARALDNGTTAEVLRLTTDGTPNACSILYSACARAAKALGYLSLITYTRADELGASLRAAGWTQTGETQGRQWSCTSRLRKSRETVDRRRWEGIKP